MIRLLIADDHAIVRDGLKQLFSHAKDIEIVAEAENGKQVLDYLGRLEADIVVLDVSMPLIGGMDLIPRILAIRPDMPILVLSMYNEPQIALNMIKAGAAGYVTKDSDPAVLLSAVYKVLAGGRYISERLAEQIIFFQRSGIGDERPHERLSKRELQVMQLLASGKSIGEAADELNISHKTVSTHKTRIMKKMAFASNARLIRYAVMHGLVE